MRSLRLRISLIGLCWSIALTACALRSGSIEPVVADSTNNLLGHRLTASTNCAEVGEEVVFTAEVTNPADQPIRVIETPPFDIIIQPYDGSGPIVRWSETDQYPAEIDPELQAGETRRYTWRWIAMDEYVNVPAMLSGIAVDMPISFRRPQGGGAGPSHADLTVGVKLNPKMGGTGGMFCTDIPRGWW